MEHIEFIDNDGIRRVALPFDENRVNLVSCNFMDGAAEVVENGDLFYVVATKSNTFDNYACEVQLSVLYSFNADSLSVS